MKILWGRDSRNRLVGYADPLADGKWVVTYADADGHALPEPETAPSRAEAIRYLREGGASKVSTE